MESLESHLPCLVSPWGGRGLRLQAPCAQWTLFRGPLHLHHLCSHFTCCWVPLPSLCPGWVFCVSNHRCSPMLTFSCVLPLSPSLQSPLFLPLLFLLSVLILIERESCPGNPPSSSFGGKDQPQETNPFSCLLETSRPIFPSQERNTTGCWPHQWISRNVC